MIVIINVAFSTLNIVLVKISKIMKLWIARNIDNTLVLFQSKPIINNNVEWDETLNEDYMFIPEYFYPEVTFENSPQQIEIKLINE